MFPTPLSKVFSSLAPITIGAEKLEICPVVGAALGYCKDVVDFDTIGASARDTGAMVLAENCQNVVCRYSSTDGVISSAAPQARNGLSGFEFLWIADRPIVELSANLLSIGFSILARQITKARLVSLVPNRSGRSKPLVVFGVGAFVVRRDLIGIRLPPRDGCGFLSDNPLLSLFVCSQGVAALLGVSLRPIHRQLISLTGKFRVFSLTPRDVGSVSHLGAFAALRRLGVSLSAMPLRTWFASKIPDQSASFGVISSDYVHRGTVRSLNRSLLAC